MESATDMSKGPYYMFQKLVHDWKEERGLGPREVADKVKRFYHFYCKAFIRFVSFFQTTDKK